MRDERLRDDLERSRKQRLDLEAALLDRDSRAMEIKFDLEAKTQDVERLRRRCKELESAYRTVSSSTGVSGMRGGALGSPSRAGGGRTAWAEGSTCPLIQYTNTHQTLQYTTHLTH